VGNRPEAMSGFNTLDNFLNLTIRPNVISVAYSTFVLELYMAFLSLCGSIVQN
jgi:hypothetical protein